MDGGWLHHATTQARLLPIKRNHILIPKGPLRADLRAITPMGLTQAVYLSNRAG
jgi:hypothetical protein